MNGGFDFSRAMIDPWASTEVGKRFYAVLIRRKSEATAFQTITLAPTHEQAAIDTLKSLPVLFLEDVKDIRVIEMTEMPTFDFESLVDRVLAGIEIV